MGMFCREKKSLGKIRNSQVQKLREIHKLRKQRYPGNAIMVESEVDKRQGPWEAHTLVTIGATGSCGFLEKLRLEKNDDWDNKMREVGATVRPYLLRTFCYM